MSEVASGGADEARGLAHDRAKVHRAEACLTRLSQSVTALVTPRGSAVDLPPDARFGGAAAGDAGVVEEDGEITGVEHTAESTTVDSPAASSEGAVDDARGVEEGGETAAGTESSAVPKKKKKKQKTPRTQVAAQMRVKREHKGCDAFVDGYLTPSVEEPETLCHLHGVINAEKGLAFKFGARCSGKWAYAHEFIETEHALAFKYKVREQPMDTFTLVGEFFDDPSIWGKYMKRTDTMTLRLLPNGPEIEGEGRCDFYGPYTVTGQLILNEQRSRGALQITKIRPAAPAKPAAAKHAPPAKPADEDDELDYDSDTSYKLYCGPNCCCKRKKD